MIISLIVLIFFVLIVALGIFCLGLVVSLIQLIINFLVANILPIVLVIFSLFALLVILAIFLPESKETENDTEKKEDKDQEINSQRSTTKASNKEKTSSDLQKINKTTIDVKSTVVREQPKSNKSHQKNKSYQASVKHNNQAKLSSDRPSSSNENKRQTQNCYATQATVSQHRVNTESYFSRERTQISYADFSEEVRPKLKQLKLSQPKSTIQSGETIQFKLTGIDQFNNQIKICDRISWLATAGEIDSRGLFSIDSIDKALVTITAKVNEIEATAKVNIENIYELLEQPKLKSLKVIPDCVVIESNKEKVFRVLGYDQYKNQIDCGEITWSATGGKIDQNGKLMVNNNAKGIYQVTATSKDTAKHGTTAKATLLTLGVSTRILSWAIANEEFFYDVLAPLLNLTNDDDSLSETDALVQGWIIEIGRRRIAKLLKKVSNLSFKGAFRNLSDSVDYIVLPELRKIEFVNPPSNLKSGDLVQLNVIGLDQAGDRINLDNQIIWTANSGSINSQGIFIANSDTDSVEITAKIIDKNIETRIKIKVESTFEAEYVELGEIRASNKLSDLGTAIVSKITQRTTDNKFGSVEEQSSKDSVYIQETQNLSHARNSSDISPSKTNKEDSCSLGKQSRETPFINKDFAAESQSNSPGFASLNTNSVYGNNNLASKNSFKLPDNLPAPEAPLYSTNNYISLSEPSWFYRSQVFHDGFFEGDFSYNTYLEYMSTKDYYSCFK